MIYIYISLLTICIRIVKRISLSGQTFDSLRCGTAAPHHAFREEVKKMNKTKVLRTAAAAILIAAVAAAAWAGLAAQLNRDVPDFLRDADAALMELGGSIVGLAVLAWPAKDSE